MTPEGKIKHDISKALTRDGVYYFMPVQNGYGAAGLDYHCYLQGDGHAIAFFIEAKRPGKDVTDRQGELIEEHRGRRCKCFVIDGWAGVVELTSWINANLNT